MSNRTVGAAEFKAKCLGIIEQMNDDGCPVVVTKRGRPVALLTPLPETPLTTSIIGALKGSVRSCDDPFGPALDADEWTSVM